MQGLHPIILGMGIWPHRIPISSLPIMAGDTNSLGMEDTNSLGMEDTNNPPMAEGVIRNGLGHHLCRDFPRGNGPAGALGALFLTVRLIAVAP